MQNIDSLLYQKQYEKAFISAKELLFQARADTFKEVILQTQALDRICYATHSLIYIRYLDHSLLKAEPFVEVASIQDQTTFFTLKTHLFLYKNDLSNAKEYYEKTMQCYEKLLKELSLQRSHLDYKALAFHQVKSDIRLLQLEMAEFYFQKHCYEEGRVLLEHAIVDKDLPYLVKRREYLRERCNFLVADPAHSYASKQGLTPLQFELLQTYKELYILEKYFHYSSESQSEST